MGSGKSGAPLDGICADPNAPGAFPGKNVSAMAFLAEGSSERRTTLGKGVRRPGRPAAGLAAADIAAACGAVTGVEIRIPGIDYPFRRGWERKGVGASDGFPTGVSPASSRAGETIQADFAHLSRLFPRRRVVVSREYIDKLF